MATLSIASWNINSVRLRAPIVRRYLEMAQPDVLCLQEIKCRTGEFPSAAFADLGYVHAAIMGQKGWHGVAILSRLPLEEAAAPDLCPRGEARVVAARVAGVEIHNLYVPAGGDEPDPAVNEKFAHKLAVMARMRAHYAARAQAGGGGLVLVGDLNIAPGEHDVWSHKALLDVVSHTPVETEALGAVCAQGGFLDLARIARPDPEKLFTWWSYRSPDWTVNNRGRRLDHIWATHDLGAAFEAAGPERFSILTEARAWEKPSDHVPVLARFAL
jgi:exodeoxyribonuclease-3